jgi:hypothetical protein
MLLDDVLPSWDVHQVHRIGIDAAADRVYGAETVSRLTTETRILCTDDVSRRRFRWNRRLIGPFSGVLRNEALLQIKRHAERVRSA